MLTMSMPRPPVLRPPAAAIVLSLKHLAGARQPVGVSRVNPLATNLRYNATAAPRVKPMSSLSTVSRVLAVFLMASGAAAGAALAADPPRKAAPPAKSVKAVNCGELPRGGKAYRDCLAAEQQRRDAGQDPAVKPVFSSR
jgi:hypothetical protein